MTRTCGTCAAFAPNPTAMHPKAGSCRLGPPQILPAAQGYSGGWPPTATDLWCMAWLTADETSQPQRNYLTLG